MIHNGNVILRPIVKITSDPKRSNEVLCIGCGHKVIPGLCYTGSIIKDRCYTTIKGHTKTPLEVTYSPQVEVTVSCNAPPPTETTSIMPSRVVNVAGGDLIETSRPASYFKRVKGHICSDCAANYHTVKDSRGNVHQVVKTDAREGYLKTTAISPYEERQSPRRLSVLKGTWRPKG